MNDESRKRGKEKWEERKNVIKCGEGWKEGRRKEGKEYQKEKERKGSERVNEEERENERRRRDEKINK